MKKHLPRVGFLEDLFTRQERTALIFLTGISLLGLGVMALGRTPTGILPPTHPSHVLPSRVAVNRASVGELAALPGVGPATARRIAEERNQSGRFLTLSDLARVKGIGQKTLQRLKPLLCFD